MKLSEQPVKVSNPGILQVRRYQSEGKFFGDIIWHEEWEPQDGRLMTFAGEEVHLNYDKSEDLLIPVFHKGKQVYSSPDIHQIRTYCLSQLERLDEKILRHEAPAVYPNGLESRLSEIKNEMIQSWKKESI